MKITAKISVTFSLLMMLTACKKNDDTQVSATGDTTISASTADTINSQGSGDAATGNATENSTGTTANPKLRNASTNDNKSEKLTQHQIDSIKTERGALITPPENVGPSLTPGSGRATPKNNKVGRGTTATMGSSTGN